MIGLHSSPIRRLRLLALALAIAVPALAQAQAQAGSATAPASAPPSPSPSAAMADGEVRKIDKDAGKLTLKHGEIRNLDMPPMTMVFSVKDKAMLDKLQPGDKVKFKAVSEGGKITVTEIEIETAN